MLLYASAKGRNIWLTVAGLTVLYAAIVAIPFARPLWFDELLSYDIAKTANLGELLRRAQSWDLNPPQFHLLAHGALTLFDQQKFACRIPSVIAFYLASMFFFWWITRAVGRPFAPISVLLLWLSPAFPYATEARPYALLCFWFACLLLAWDYAIRGEHRRAAIAALGMANMGLLYSHVFAPLTLFPFVVAESWRAFRRRAWDIPVFAALLLPMLLTLTYIPLYRSFKSIALFAPAFQASSGKGIEFYSHDLFRLTGCFIAAAAAGLVLRRRTAPHRVVVHIPECWWILLAGFALNPLILVLVLMWNRAPFWGRYAITSELVFALAAALLLAFLLTRFRASAGAAAGGLLLLLLLGRLGVPIYKAVTHPNLPNAAVLETLSPEQPVVVADGQTFVEMSQNEENPLTRRLYYLQDQQAAKGIAHATVYDDLKDFQREFGFSGNIEPYSGFVNRHRKFLVLATPNTPGDWLLQKLAADGATIHLARCYRLPYRDKNVYSVELSGYAAAENLSRSNEFEIAHGFDDPALISLR